MSDPTSDSFSWALVQSKSMRLITTLSLGAALACVALSAAAQPLRLAAVPAAVASPSSAGPAPATDRNAPPTSAPSASAAPAAGMDEPPSSAPSAGPAPVAAAPAPGATIASAAPVLNPNPDSDGIAATVNDTSISDYELDQRIAMHIAVSGYAPAADDLKRIRKQMLEQLEDEKIELADARAHKLTVSPVEVNRQIESFAKSHNATVKELTDVLAKAGTSIDVLRVELTASIAWQKTLQQEFADEVVVTPPMIADSLRRAAEGANKAHYHVSELFLQVDSPDKDAEVKKQMDDIEAQIRGGTGSFAVLAQQYSRNPSAAQGGDIGWVYDGQLDPELNNVLAKMKPGELSQPVRGRGGWYLLGLRERQEPLGTNVSVPAPVAPSGPPGTLPLARLLLPILPDTPQQNIDNVMQVAQQIRAVVTSCDVLEKLSQEASLKGSVFEMLGNVKLTDVSEQMQKALAPTVSGEVAAPFLSDAGVEVIARCDARPALPRIAFKLPTEDDVHEQLFQDQISALALHYMRDLKRDANIQERGAPGSVLDAALIP